MKIINLDRLQKLVTKRITEDIATHHILGASVLVRQEGRIFMNARFGYADLARSKPLKENSIFRLASLSKVVTAVAAMIGLERGWFSLQDPVEKYLPHFSRLCHGSLRGDGQVLRGGPLKQKVTVYHLLTHSSLIDCGDLYSLQCKEMTPEQDATLASALEFYSTLAMEKEPGTQHSYSGTLAFDILAGILEVCSGKSLEEFIREEITEPLGMADTTFTPTPEQWGRLVEMHDQKDGVSVKGKTTPGCIFLETPVSHPLAGAGLVSTVRDYDRFAQMLLNEGSLDGKRILKPETVRRMRTPTPQLEGSSNRWGLGVRVVDNDKKILPLGSFGWSGAFGTHCWVDPENQITVVYMKNSYYDGGGSAATSRHMEEDVVNSFEN